MAGTGSDLRNINGEKAAFFDSPLVKRLSNQGAVRALYRIAGYTNRVMKNSVRYTTKPESSPAGGPAFARRSDGFKRSHTNKKTGVVKTRPTSPYKELMQFGLDPERLSAVVGPAEFRAAAKKAYKAPEALEKGGTVTIKRGTKISRITIRPRPTANLALKKSVPKFPGMFRDTIRV